MTSVGNHEKNSKMDPKEISSNRATILFDGVCNLCDGWVKFVIERDPKGYFFFAALQSEAGQRLLSQNKLPE